MRFRFPLPDFGSRDPTNGFRKRQHVRLTSAIPCCIDGLTRFAHLRDNFIQAPFGAPSRVKLSAWFPRPKWMGGWFLD